MSSKYAMKLPFRYILAESFLALLLLGLLVPSHHFHVNAETEELEPGSPEEPSDVQPSTTESGPSELQTGNVAPATEPGPPESGSSNETGNVEPATIQPGPWKHAHATFYEGDSGSFGGACGYPDVVKEGYGLETVALSDALFEKGMACGSCFELKCEDSPQWCKPGQPSLLVTATNHCPPNFDKPSDNGGWCNPPREHFDIAKPVFLKIAEYKAGIVPVTYRRIPCTHKTGGMKFTITGSTYYSEVLVWNVGGAGEVTNVEVKGDNKLTEWTPMNRAWGQKWCYNGKLQEESLSFRVTASDGTQAISSNVAPKNWQFGQTYEGKNFG